MSTIPDSEPQCPQCHTPISPARLEELVENPGRWMYCDGRPACRGQVRLLPPTLYWSFPPSRVPRERRSPAT
jgi:hypothetical protein